MRCEVGIKAMGATSSFGCAVHCKRTFDVEAVRTPWMLPTQERLRSERASRRSRSAASLSAALPDNPRTSAAEHHMVRRPITRYPALSAMRKHENTGFSGVTYERCAQSPRLRCGPELAGVPHRGPTLEVVGEQRRARRRGHRPWSAEPTIRPWSSN